jgi:hypothetical protein
MAARETESIDGTSYGVQWAIAPKNEFQQE